MRNRENKKRLVAAAIAMLAGAVLFPHSASAISLKSASVVSDKTITLGDIFTGLPEGGDRVLGLAPQPGQEMVLNARTLLRIALALDLPWRPVSAADQVVVTRAATIISREAIDAALAGKLQEHGVTGKYKTVIDDGMAQIILPRETEAGVEVDSFKYKPESGHFEAVLVSPSMENPLHRTKITGTVQKMTSIPVLRETLPSGSVIGMNDIDYIEVKETDLQQQTILRAEDLVGMSPRRMQYAGKPLRTSDMEMPRIVTRGDTVTMLLQAGGMTLTASGKALENGAKGDFIRVMNTSSNKMIEGLVTASKEVTVKTN